MMLGALTTSYAAFPDAGMTDIKELASILNNSTLRAESMSALHRLAAADGSVAKEEKNIIEQVQNVFAS